MPLEQNQPPVPQTHASSASAHLAFAGLAAQLPDRLDEQEQPAHARVAGRQPAAVGVGRQGPAERSRPSSTNAPPSPLAQKPRSSSVTSVM